MKVCVGMEVVLHSF